MDTSTLAGLTRATSFLRHVPVLAALPEQLLAHLAGQVHEVHVPAGHWILREGDPAGSMFIVASGRVDVVHEGPPETLLRVLRRGDVIGELALLQEGVRSASARAQRDTDLLELGRAQFESLLEHTPSFAIGMARALAAQVAVSRSQRTSVSPPRIIAVVGLDGAAPAAEVGQMLADALGVHGKTARLLSGDVASVARAERRSPRVVLVAPGHPWEEWTRLCLSESDVVLAVSTGRPDPAWMQVSALRGCELLAIGAAVDERTLQVLLPREVQVVAGRLDQKAALDAMARRLAGRSLGIVLSGGGARALAHIGVLEELWAAGLRFDRVAGVSMGALIAALAAMGLNGEEVYSTCVRGLVRKNPTRDFTLPAYSFIRGATTRRLLHDVFGERRIEELPHRFFCLSCDLVSREAVVHRTGRLFDAVYPSLALPGVFPPVSDGRGRLLVDGAVLDNLPAATMSCRGEGPVIAVDATIGPQRQFKPAQRPRPARIGRAVRRVLTGSEHTIPRFTETIVRSMTVGSANSVATACLQANLVITPAIEGIGLLDWKAIDRMRELGRDAARRALDSDPGLLAGLGA